MNKKIALTKSQMVALKNNGTLFVFRIMNQEQYEFKDSGIYNISNENYKKGRSWSYSDFITDFAPIQEGDRDIFVKEDFFINEQGNISYVSDYSEVVGFKINKEMTEKESRFSFSKCISVKISTIQDFVKSLESGFLDREQNESLQEDFISQYNKQIKEQGLNRTYKDNDYVFIVKFENKYTQKINASSLNFDVLSRRFLIAMETIQKDNIIFDNAQTLDIEMMISNYYDLLLYYKKINSTIFEDYTKKFMDSYIEWRKQREQDKIEKIKTSTCFNELINPNKNYNLENEQVGFLNNKPKKINISKYKFTTKLNSSGLLKDLDIYYAPVNINKIVENLKIKVKYVEFKKDLKAKILIYPNSDTKPTFFISNKENKRNQRFLLAQQIAHYINDGIQEDMDFKNRKIKIKEKTLYLKRNAINPIKQRAIIYAERLLLPKNIFIEKLSKLKNELFPNIDNDELGIGKIIMLVQKLSDIFEVNTLLISTRLFSLKLISDSTRLKLNENLELIQEGRI